MLFSSETKFKFQELISIDSTSPGLHYWKTVLDSDTSFYCFSLNVSCADPSVTSQIDFISQSGKFLYSITNKDVATSKYFQKNKQYFKFEIVSVDKSNGKNYLLLNAYYIEQVDTLNVRNVSTFIAELFGKEIKNITPVLLCQL